MPPPSLTISGGEEALILLQRRVELQLESWPCSDHLRAKGRVLDVAVPNVGALVRSSVLVLE